MTKKKKMGSPMRRNPKAMRGGMGAARRGAKTMNRQKRIKETATGTRNQTCQREGENTRLYRYS